MRSLMKCWLARQLYHYRQYELRGLSAPRAKPFIDHLFMQPFEDASWIVERLGILERFDPWPPPDGNKLASPFLEFNCTPDEFLTTVQSKKIVGPTREEIITALVGMLDHCAVDRYPDSKIAWSCMRELGLCDDKYEWTEHGQKFELWRQG